MNALNDEHGSAQENSRDNKLVALKMRDKGKVWILQGENHNEMQVLPTGSVILSLVHIQYMEGMKGEN